MVDWDSQNTEDPIIADPDLQCPKYCFFVFFFLETTLLQAYWKEKKKGKGKYIEVKKITNSQFVLK